MSPMTRRDLIDRGAKLALGTLVFSVPETLYRLPWTRLAAAQNLPNVEADFTAAVEAVTGTADADAARWIIHEFDRALPPLPNRVAVTAAVAAVLDARTVAAGFAPTFAQASADQRREVLGGMVKDPEPDIRQIANQLIPFCAFAYWSDAAMDRPARPGGPRLPRWNAIGFPGPSHGYRTTYTEDSPTGFSPMTDFEK